jgi:hypothetical protein
MIKYHEGAKETRNPIYIPVGTFITAWARYKTITSAQAVFDRFIYADTDSLHLTGTSIPDELEVDDSALGKWKHESTFKRARFIRQKSYMEIESISQEEYSNLKPEKREEWLFSNLTTKEVEKQPHIVCSGLPESCYKYVTWDNFQEGVIYEGKLQTKRVKGGIVLTDTTFEIKAKKNVDK